MSRLPAFVAAAGGAVTAAYIWIPTFEQASVVKTEQVNTSFGNLISNVWVQAKHYQIQFKKKEAEMAELLSKREKGVLTAKDYENECARVSLSYPLVQDTPAK
jgi:hypothetical protein